MMLGHKTTEDRDDLDDPTLEEVVKRAPQQPASWPAGAPSRIAHLAHRVRFLENLRQAYRGPGGPRPKGVVKVEVPDDINAAIALLPEAPPDWRQDGIGRIEYATARVQALEEILVSYRIGPLHRAPTRCSQHPKYQVKRAPRTDCSVCQLMWEAAELEKGEQQS